MHEFEVALSGPIDLRASLEWFGRWGEDLMARWEGRILTRTARVQGRSVPFACTVSGTVRHPAFTVRVRTERHVEPVREQVSQMFATTPRSFERLLEVDRTIARLNRRFPGVRPALQLDPFTALIRSISAQQVNLHWAVTTRNRLAEAFGVKHRIGNSFVYSLNPRRLAAADVSDIRALQFTTNKSKSILAVARAMLRDEINLRDLKPLADEQIIERLTKLPGIGVWTAEWFLARTLGRARVVAGDLGVRKAVGGAYSNGALPSEREVRTLTAHWGEAAGIAQQLLLHALSHNEL